jgi:hypothetical protein
MSSAALTQFQAGIEATRGTAVAATRKLYCDAQLPVEDDNIEMVHQARNQFVANFDALQNHVSATWSLEEVFNFHEMAFWLQLAAKGGVTPTGIDPYIWTFNGMATSDDLATMTLEAADDEAALRAPFGVMTSWEIAGQDGNGPAPLMFNADFIFAGVDDNALTGAIADRDISGHYGLFRNTALYLDAVAGSIGTTEVAASLMSFAIRVDNQVQANYPGNTGGRYTSINRDKRHCEVELNLLLNATAYAEFTSAYKNGTARFGRIRNVGAGDDQFDIDFHAARWHKWEPTVNGPTRRVTLLAQTVYDPTLGFDWQIALRNNLAAL